MEEKTGSSSERTGGRMGNGGKEEEMKEQTGNSSDRTGGRNGERKERGSNGGTGGI